MLFVLDRYVRPTAAWAGRAMEVAALYGEAVEWLECVALQCPEQGVPE